ncbi:hypothetical protein [Paenibacillus donghaensis]|uniref:Uncharacterized protein n=1 Tax=Paenibacillus donghaensis TaxID=414771 RepID=A0A2Z2KJY6_9BACL|nr:hypothetical protein [Paenibacillus donghaensis]ASA22649.1 hypothetical protein B9T62_18755 [Paenibacillus donghaensis]
MGDTYSLAVPSDKKTYYLGTISSAIRCLPLLLEDKCIDKEVILFYDGGFRSDKYDGADEFGPAGTAGFFGEMYDSYPISKGEWVEKNMLDGDEFFNLMHQCTSVTSLIYLGEKKFEMNV